MMTDTKDAAQALRDAGWLVVEPGKYEEDRNNLYILEDGRLRRTFLCTGEWNIPDTIDWSHVDPKYRYMARDKNGKVWFFENEPDCLVFGGAWVEDEDNGGAVEVHGFASYRRGTVPWDKSLVCREDEE